MNSEIILCKNIKLDKNYKTDENSLINSIYPNFNFETDENYYIDSDFISLIIKEK